MAVITAYHGAHYLDRPSRFSWRRAFGASIRTIGFTSDRLLAQDLDQPAPLSPVPDPVQARRPFRSICCRLAIRPSCPVASLLRRHRLPQWGWVTPRGICRDLIGLGLQYRLQWAVFRTGLRGHLAATCASIPHGFNPVRLVASAPSTLRGVCHRAPAAIPNLPRRTLGHQHAARNGTFPRSLLARVSR